jgi:excisionase family DNA binding protein
LPMVIEIVVCRASWRPFYQCLSWRFVMREFIGSILGVKELARYLGYSEITIYRLVEAGRIPARKVGAQWRFLKDEIDCWLREKR